MIADSPCQISRISRYEIISQIGEGGIGIVYKAVDPNLNKTVAIKVLSGGNLRDDQKARFQNEAKALAELKHRLIPEIYNFSVMEDGSPYMVMEFIEGISLDYVIKQEESLPVCQVVDIALQVCDALSHAHSLGVFHRDIKPSNIILQKEGPSQNPVKIVDFGLVKFEVALGREQFLTRTGTVVGSPAYMSPEQIRTDQIDGRSDVYSLGCVLFEMLTGHPPFHGKSVFETVSLHLSSEPPTLSELLSPKDKGFADIVSKCLAKNPADRYQSMSELRRDIEEEQSKLRLRSSSSSTAASTESLSPTKISGWLLGLTAVSIIGILCLLLILFDQEKEKPARKVDDVTKFPDYVDALGTPWMRVSPNAINGSFYVKDEDFKSLSNFPIVRLECCMSQDVTGRGLAYLEPKSIRWLVLKSESLNDEAFDHIKNMTRLEALSVGTQKLSCKAINSLAGLRKLRTLGFRTDLLPAGAMAAIARVDSLQNLYIRGNKGQSIDLRPLSRMVGLKTLALDGYSVSNQDIAWLKSSKLERLLMPNMGLNDDNMGVLSTLPLKELDLSFSYFTDRTVSMLAGLSPLKKLDLTGCRNVTADGIRRFKKARPDCELIIRSDYSPSKGQYIVPTLDNIADIRKRFPLYFDQE